ETVNTGTKNVTVSFAQPAANYVPSSVNSFAMQGSFTTTMLNPSIGYRGGVPGGYGPALGFAPDQTQTAQASPGQQAIYDMVAPSAPLDTLMRSLDHDYTYSVWGSAYGGYSSLTGNTGAGSATATTGGGGLASGIDYRFKQDTVLGFALGGGSSSWNATGSNSGTSAIFQAGVYGSHRFDQAYISGSLAYAFNQLTSVRAATFDAKFNGNGADGRLEGGYQFQMPQVNLTPYVAAEVFALATPAYSETSSTATAGALKYSALTTTDMRAEVGLWADKTFTLDDNSKFLIRGKVGYAHDTWNNVMLNAQFVSLPTPSFTLTGITPPANLGLASLVSEIRYLNGWSLGAKLDGEFASGSYSVGATGSVKYSW
ncbi:MAG TPA: autotransporter outer membrane beta-barrel domain-containing protein, partial [Xanthobacteraceae bacterium]|nr:autotransporter outer membrane beta-barrel domain-containing protein [Xanthobacteraceae bacterium]